MTSVCSTFFDCAHAADGHTRVKKVGFQARCRLIPQVPYQGFFCYVIIVKPLNESKSNFDTVYIRINYLTSQNLIVVL